jgi:hypothetical protein
MLQVFSVFGALATAISFLVSFAVPAHAAVDQKPSAFVLCKNKKNVRTIRVLPEGRGQDNCTITYSKGGSEEVVGSNRSLGTCKSILKNIQMNLETSNWNCRSVQSALVTTSSEAITQ